MRNLNPAQIKDHQKNLKFNSLYYIYNRLLDHGNGATILLSVCMYTAHMGSYSNWLEKLILLSYSVSD